MFISEFQILIFSAITTGVFLAFIIVFMIQLFGKR